MDKNIYEELKNKIRQYEILDSMYERRIRLSEFIEGEVDNNRLALLKTIETEYKSMQVMKEQGFYVDIDKDKQNLIAPDSIGKQVFERQFLRTNISLLFCEKWYEVNIKKEDAIILKNMIRMEENMEP